MRKLLHFVLAVLVASPLMAGEVRKLGIEDLEWGNPNDTVTSAGGVVSHPIDNTYKLSSPWVDVRAYGALGDNTTDDTAKFQEAIDAAYASNSVLFIPAKWFKVTSTTGNFALTFKGPVVGVSPTTSVIYNSGTGSAVKWENYPQSIAGYYQKLQNFSIVGNASSEDGLVLNPTSSIYKAVSYSTIDSVYVYGHGRHGVVHWASWATRYINCKFGMEPPYDNKGLGFWLHGAGGDNLNWSNNITFINCESRWNGGDGAVGGGDYGHGGYRLDGGINGVHFFGGVTESNNNWDFIIGLNWATGAIHVQQLSVQGMHFEDTPRKNGSASYSTTGGKFYIAAGAYESIDIHHNYMVYGAGTGGIGYAFYTDNTTVSGGFAKEHDNHMEAYGGGTNTLYAGDSKMLLDWSRTYVSIPFGDTDANDNGTTATTILSAAADGGWFIVGHLSCKIYDQVDLGTYQFTAVRSTSVAAGVRQASIDNTNVIGTAPTIPPTVAWSGDNLQVTTGIAHWCNASIDISGVLPTPPDTFSLNTAIFTNDFVYRTRPQ